MGVLWGRVKKFVADDSLSIALFSLFLLCVTAQGLSGWAAYNEALQAAHFHRISLGAYLATGNFLDGIFSNWQAAVLQLAVLIAFGTVLRQKGAAHSRKPEAENRRRFVWKLGPRPTLHQWFKSNSLSLTLIGMFGVTFLLHLLFGHWSYNEEQALRHLAPISFGAYAVSSSFWVTAFQCWEAEFAAIGIYIVLSIFLRQERSPESKPVGASNQQTGGANE